MKLKLFEAEIPISKLEYNIEKNLIPRFANYGLSFQNKPTQINKYKYLYNGVSEGMSNQLYLSTTNPEIDIWNKENPDIYVADLYGELKMNGSIEQLGPLSSKKASSVDEAMMSINIENNKFMSPEALDNAKIYEPKQGGTGLDPMTKAEWIQLKQELETELKEIEAELHKADEANDDETYYNLYKYTYKDKRDYYDRIFIPNYPFI